MHETTNEEQKTTVIKTLAIIGFVVALVFVAWLAVQAVRLVPAAFTTLASIATGLKNNKQSDFTIATGTNIVNTGETLTISWTKPAQSGEYLFLYTCTDGVVAEMSGTAGTLSTVPCATDTPLGQNQNSVAVVFSSEKKRFVDVSYTISFTPDGTSVANKRQGIITVVNPGITATRIATNTIAADMPQSASTTTNSTNPVVSYTPTTSNTATTSQPTTASSTKPKVAYRTVPVVVTTYPVSNPAGYSDLAVTFIGVGTYNASTQIFTPLAFLNGNTRAAIRFEVKNIGTKTSGDWYFNASLPTTPGFTYTSTANAALKPNERQVVTLEFTATSGASNQLVTVAVTGGNDTIATNNFFSRQVQILFSN